MHRRLYRDILIRRAIKLCKIFNSTDLPVNMAFPMLILFACKKHKFILSININVLRIALIIDKDVQR